MGFYSQFLITVFIGFYKKNLFQFLYFSIQCVIYHFFFNYLLNLQVISKWKVKWSEDGNL